MLLLNEIVPRSRCRRNQHLRAERSLSRSGNTRSDCGAAIVHKAESKAESAHLLGSGATSVVYRCPSGKTGKYVAVKRLSSPAARSAATSPKARDEFKRTRSLHHDNIVSYIALGWEGNLTMEYVDGGSLADFIGRNGPLGEAQAVRVAVHVARGLAYMHVKNMIHRDVKPANILIDTRTNTFKLCDWIGQEEFHPCPPSISSTPRPLSSNPSGTPVFLAPEVVRSGRHCPSSDTWALACTVINLISGRLPWADEDNVFAAMFKTAHDQAPPFDSQHMSQPMINMLALSFEPDPVVRPDAAALLVHMHGLMVDDGTL